MADASTSLEILLTAKDQASKVLDSVSKEAQGFGKTLGDVGKIAGGFLAGGAIAGGLAKVSGFIGESISAASDLGESMNAVNKIFGDSSATILKWGDDQANSYGLSQRAFNDLAVPLGAGLRNAGLASDVVAEKTVDLTKRAADMASVFNTDVGEALEAIQSGLRGEADPLERFGVGLSAAAVEAQALADTGKTNAKELTNQELALARVNLIMAQTSSTAGDFTATSDGLANATRIQNAKMEELQATIGTKLLPVQLLITKAKLAMVDALVTHVLPAIDSLIKYIKFVVEDGDKMNDFLMNVPEPLRGVAKAMADVALFIKNDLIPAIEKVIAVVKDHWPEISAVIKFAADFVKTQIEGMIQMIEGIVEVVTGVIDLVSALWHGDWSKAWEAMKQIAEGTLDIFIGNLKRMFGNIPEIILGLATDLFNAGMNMAGQIIDGVRRGLENFSVKVGFDSGIPGVPGISKTIRPFSFLKEGLDYVPYDNFPAMLHKGERVVPAAENRPGSGGVTVNIDTVYARDEGEARRAGNDIGFALRRSGYAA